MFDAEAGPSHVIADDSHNETPYVTPKPLVFGSSSSENDDSLSLEHQAAIEKQKWKADTESIPDLEAQRFHARGNPAQPEEKAEEPIVSTGGTMNPDNKEKSVLDSAKSTEPLLHRILKKNHPLIPVFRRKRSWKSVAEEKGRDSEEAQSNEDNAAERTEIRPKKKMPQKEAEAGVEVHGKSRMEERQWIQEYLERSANHDHPPSLLPDDEVLNNHHHSPILLAMANRIYRTKDYTFMNFERLAILNVLHWQHALIEFDEKYRITKKEDQTLHEKEDGTKIFSLSQTLEKYRTWAHSPPSPLFLSPNHHPTKLIMYFVDESLTILHNATTKYRSPDSIAAREFGPLFARELKEPRYWDSEDALNLFDLSLETGPGTADSLRRVLQRYCPTSMLDKGGKNERELRSKPKSELSRM